MSFPGYAPPPQAPVENAPEAGDGGGDAEAGGDAGGGDAGAADAVGGNLDANLMLFFFQNKPEFVWKVKRADVLAH